MGCVCGNYTSTFFCMICVSTLYYIAFHVNLIPYFSKYSVSTFGLLNLLSCLQIQKKNEDSLAVQRKSTTDTEDESDEENEEENQNGVADKSEDGTSEKSESEDRSDSGSESEDMKEKKKPSKTSSTKKESAKKSKIEKIPVANKSHIPPKRTPKKLSSNLSKSDEDSDESPKVSRKKKNYKGGKQKTSTPTKPSSKEKTGRYHLKMF